MESGSGLVLVPTVVSSALHFAVMTVHLAAMQRRSKNVPTITPRITILKPLAGRDDDLEANLESFAKLDYPDYEILFGVASNDDPAAPVARKFAARHRNARVVITDPASAINPKVAQLIALERAARGEVVVISDSNVRVQRDYLRSIASELEQPGVGLVTNVFSGTGERSIGAALENLQLSTMTAPAVVASSVLPLCPPLTVGKSMAMRRSDLERIGGFERVADVLAEDYVLGRLFREAKMGVRISRHVIENRNVDCSPRRTLERHARWAKMRRAVCPLAFLLEPLLCPLVVATACLAIAPSMTTALAVLVATSFQVLLAFASVRVLRGHPMRWYLAPLEVVRSYAVLFCWARALVSRRIEWRGHPFSILPGSRIVPARPEIFPERHPTSMRAL